MTRRAPLALLALLASLAGVLTAQELPPGFVRERVGSTFDDPIALAFLDEQRLLVAERAGRVWFVDHDVKRNLVLDLAGETNSSRNRGLFGLAAEPGFGDGGWIYLLHSVRVPGELPWGPGYARLLRVRAELDEQGDLVARPETRQILLGETWATGISSCVDDHTLGSLRFLSDGSLVLSTGDNTSPGLDTGGMQPDCFLPGRTPPEEDVGSYRSQLLDSLDGKVLRVDPETGLGLADNPFFTGDPADARSRVYALGLRNAFRLALLPGSGPREALLVADVGWDDWEEIDLCLGGENFGWPCFEGPGPRPEFQALDSRGLCAGVVPTPPLLTWHHSRPGAAGFSGNCASGLCVYTGERYPEVYRGRLFFFDYERNWLRAAELGADRRIADTLVFGTRMNSPVELVAQPGTGDLVYVSLGTQAGSVFRIRYVGEARPPVAVASATPSWGPGDLDVTLSAEGSSDPEGLPLSFSWDLGDGTRDDRPVLVHRYPAGAAYTVRLTVTDAEELTDSAEVRITPGNTPPRILSLIAPLDDSTYVPGEPLRLLATAEDAEDGTPAAEWTLDLVHDHHVHPAWSTSTGLSALAVPDAHGEGDYHFVVRLAVTDASGLVDERSVEIFDARSQPQAHLVELANAEVRVGQTLAPVGHVDFAYGRVSARRPVLAWDWGDGTVEVIQPAEHQVDTRPTHVYRRAGEYKLRLLAGIDGEVTSVETALVRVAGPRPSVAVFAALGAERWVPRAEQEAIVAALTDALAQRASEVRAFHLGEGAALAAWMESLLADPLADVVVLIDLLPAALVEGGIPGSLLERWVAAGNGLVWTGATPFQALLADDGSDAQTLLGADVFLGATAPYVVLGEGPQLPTPLGRRVVPSLAGFAAERALRLDQLGPAWRVARLFAADGDRDSDAVELEHSLARGSYAQFLCARTPGLPRAAVLAEYLSERLGQTRAAPGSSTPARR